VARKIVKKNKNTKINFRPYFFFNYLKIHLFFDKTEKKTTNVRTLTNEHKGKIEFN